MGPASRFADGSLKGRTLQDGQHQQDGLLDLNHVMQAFGVGEWSNLGPIEAPSAESLGIRVEIQGQRYILKERLEGLVDEDISLRSHRYAFRHFLQQAGIPIPALWLTPQGEPHVTVDDTTFELEQASEGERFSTGDRHSLEWVGAAGAMLARIHQASRRYTGPQHRWPSEAHIGGVVQGYLNLARAKAEQSEIAAIAASLSNWCDQWEAVLPSAMVSIGSVRGLPEFHIHGDYHALNLRFGSPSQGVTAVINLEASRWEKRIVELAYGLFYFSALEWRADTALTRPLVKRGFDPERFRRFLEAYAAIYPPSPQESSVLGDALLLVSPVATINGPLEDVFFTQRGIDDALIDEVMDRLAWATSLPAWLGRVRRSLGEMWR
jgi:Ser/Thr protein kinase RdoA (MazF antagonist)